MHIIDRFLDSITMYRLVLYYLICIMVCACIFSFFHILPYDPVQLGLSAVFFVVFCAWINEVFAHTWGAPANIESVYITALILACIIPPAKTVSDFLFLGWAAVLAMASKYIIAIKLKHIFNPAAFAVVLTAFFLNKSATWWVGTIPLLPIILIGGLLIVRKTRHEDMVFAFVLTVIVGTIGFAVLKNTNIVLVLGKVILNSSLFFFGFVMLTEPLTMPGTYWLQIAYSMIAGFLFIPDVHIGALFFTPELALCASNLFAYIVSPKEKLILYVKEKIQLTPDTFDYVFPLKHRLAFAPGQYMEWTLPHAQVDNRGNRRYFTLASSPTEDTLRIGVKFYPSPSTYKKNLLAMNASMPIIASQRAGDFVLPSDATKKLVFIAGGIGITPFRSMLKYLIDTNQKRDIVVLYANKTVDEIVYADVLDAARKTIGARVLLTLTDVSRIPKQWSGNTGRINGTMITKDIPDFRERFYYISGPHTMVTAYEQVLRILGIPPEQIKTDFFPGFG